MLAREKAASRRGLGWAGEKVARSQERSGSVLRELKRGVKAADWLTDAYPVTVLSSLGFAMLAGRHLARFSNGIRKKRGEDI